MPGASPFNVAGATPLVYLQYIKAMNKGNCLSRNTNKMQLVIEFIIPKFTEGSTCFERHTAPHQEL
jgi:hypothetical protein